jgi:hypothetical protein
MSITPNKPHRILSIASFVIVVLLITFCFVSIDAIYREYSVSSAIGFSPTTTVIAQVTYQTPSATTSALQPTATLPSPALQATSPVTPSPTVITPTSTPTQLGPDGWQTLPIVPTLSQTALQIYQRGLLLGNDPHAFSKIGDCQSVTVYFLGHFDDPNLYNLGPYASLQETIDWYAGSFSRESLAVKGGFNAAAILSPFRADPTQCNSNENPVACELRLHHPSVAIISLEEWWAGHPENYEKYLRQIIEYTIDQGVVPILATKASNLEGNHLINQTIANLAIEYDIPLWNFWASVQDLPNHGLAQYDVFGQVDLFHLTRSEGFFSYDNPDIEQTGWSMRNLTALQALDAVRRGLSQQP